MRRQGKERDTDSWDRKAERALGHRFRSRALLRAALTHPSAGDEGYAFRRLEFLGDAILTFLMTLYLYERYPDVPPGPLTRLRASMVNRATLAQAGAQLRLPSLLRLGRGEAPQGHLRPTLLAASFEAIVAALFLDGGIDAAMTFLEQHLLPLFSPDASFDPKSELQHRVQAALKVSPRYRLLNHRGPPHARRFEVGVEINGEILARGHGGSRRKAEQAAARVALAHLRDNHNILRSSVR